MAVQKPNAQPARQRVSLKRDNFSSGGVLREGDYQITASEYANFQYKDAQGNLGAITLALHLQLQGVTKQGNQWVPTKDEPNEQYYSVGDPAAFAPSEDGNHIESISNRTTLSKSAKYYVFYDNLVNAGLTGPVEDQFEEQGAQFLIGLIGHIVHVPAPDYSNLRAAKPSASFGTPAQQKLAAERAARRAQFPETVPVFKVIHVAPWATASKPQASAPKAAAPVRGKTAAAPAPAQAVNGAASGGADNRLAGFIKEVVAANGNDVARTKLRLEVHRKYNAAQVDAAERVAEMGAFNDDNQLGDIMASVNCAFKEGDTSRVELIPF